MKQTYFSGLKERFTALALMALLCGATVKANSLPPVITGVAVTNGALRIDWQDGRPTYQVQTAPSVGGSWVNVGSPTTNSFALLSMTNSQGLFRVVADY